MLIYCILYTFFVLNIFDFNKNHNTKYTVVTIVQRVCTNAGEQGYGRRTDSNQVLRSKGV